MSQNNHTIGIHGLYGITPDLADTTVLLNKTEQVLAGGARLIQYRNKTADTTLLFQQAKALLQLCRTYNVPLIVNDHAELAKRIDADGVHLGKQDTNIATVRAWLGTNKIIGASCYNCMTLATQAEKDGADYVAFGACFTSETKPNAVHAPLNLFEQAKQVLSVPVVGIGGITLDNAKQVKEAGADAIAVISTLFDTEDIKAASQQFNSIYT